jgi:hypothetical protein
MMNATKKLVVKAALRVLKLDSLNVDPAYQRDVKSKHVKIVSDFNEQALGIPLVGEREDSSLWIVDGLQRVTALRKLGWIEARFEVFRSLGVEHEAAVFKLVNINRTRLRSDEEFKALLTAHDGDAWAIKECVEKEGFYISLRREKGDDNKGLTCYNALRQWYHKGGVAYISFSLRMVRDCWPGDGKGTGHHMLNGMCVFYHRHKELLDESKLIARLQTVTPQSILYAASQGSFGGGDTAQSIATQIEKVYKKRIRSV